MTKPYEIVITYPDDALPDYRLEELFKIILDKKLNLEGVQVSSWRSEDFNCLRFYFPEGNDNVNE